MTQPMGRAEIDLLIRGYSDEILIENYRSDTALFDGGPSPWGRQLLAEIERRGITARIQEET